LLSMKCGLVRWWWGNWSGLWSLARSPSKIFAFYLNARSNTCCLTGKTTLTGRKRTLLGSRSSRSVLAMTTSRSRYVPSIDLFFPAYWHTLLVKTAKIGSLVDIQDSEDPEGLRVFYYLVQDLKVRFLLLFSGILLMAFVL
jgi:hypothetical protein